MNKGISAGMILSALAALGLAFWAGRASMSETSAKPENSRFRPRAIERPTSRNSAKTSGAGVVTSALQLRDIFKHGGGDMQLGTAMADATLARMNGNQLVLLVHDLATAQASSPGYAFTLEIKTACARWAEIDPDAALKFALANKQASFRAAALGSIFAGIAKTDPALAKAKLATIDDPALRRSLQAGIMSALAISSPDEWVAAIKSDSSLRQSSNLSSITAEWAMDDPAKAAERLKQLPANMQENGVEAIAKVWAGKDSRAAMAWAQSLSNPRQRNLALAAVAGGIAASDPDAAIALLESLSPTSRRFGINSIFTTMADLDFDAALERAAALANPVDREAALARVGACGNGNWAGDPFADPFAEPCISDPKHLTEFLEKVPPGALRDSALGQLGHQLASYSSEEADAVLSSYPAKEREKLQTGMLQYLADLNPARALELYHSMPSGLVQSYNVSRIYSNLAEKDPEALLKMSLDSTSMEEQKIGIGCAFGQLTLTDPLAAYRRLDTLPAGPIHDAALESIAGAWTYLDRDAARTWAENLPSADQPLALKRLVPAIAENDPQAAAEMLGKLLKTDTRDSKDSFAMLSSSLVDQWAEQDPEAAGKWAASLQDGQAKIGAVRTLAFNWSRKDFDGATQWIGSMPDGQARDSAVHGILGTVAERDPAAAFEWATTIGDEHLRSGQMEVVVRKWINSDPDKARAAVNRADLSAGDRDRLLNQLK